MTDDVASTLVAQILEAPGDAAPLLVYADWLEQSGQPDRAELIRAQLAGNAARAAALVLAHPEWVAPITAWAKPMFQDGIVAEIYGTTGDYVKAQPLLMAHLPGLGVRSTMLRGRSKKLGTCPALAWTARLGWWDCQLREADLDAFLESPHLQRLGALTLEKIQFGNAGIAALARTTSLPRLHHLGLEAPVHLGRFDAASILALLDSPNFAIDELDLEKATGKFDCRQLVGAPLARLRYLLITPSRGLGAFARCRDLTGLQALTISTLLRIPEQDLDALAENPALTRLRRLTIRVYESHAAPTRSRLVKRFGAALDYKAVRG